MGCNLDKVQSTEAAGEVQLPVPEKLRKGKLYLSIFEVARWHDILAVSTLYDGAYIMPIHNWTSVAFTSYRVYQNLTFFLFAHGEVVWNSPWSPDAGFTKPLIKGDNLLIPVDFTSRVTVSYFSVPSENGHTPYSNPPRIEEPLSSPQANNNETSKGRYLYDVFEFFHFYFGQRHEVNGWCLAFQENLVNSDS